MRMNRSQMLDILAAGGSVAWGDGIIVHPDQVPSVAELARGNPQAEVIALADLQAQLATVQAQIESLQAAQPKATGGETGGEKDEKKPPAKPTGGAS